MVFYTFKNFFDMPTQMKGGNFFQNVAIRSCYISNFMGKNKINVNLLKNINMLLTHGVNNTWSLLQVMHT